MATPDVYLLDTLPNNRDSPTTNTSTHVPAPYRSGPWSLAIADISLILRNALYAPFLLWSGERPHFVWTGNFPFFEPANPNENSELYFGSRNSEAALENLYNMLSQLLLTILGLVLLAWLPAIFVLPGGIWLAGVAAVAVAIKILEWPLNSGEPNPDSRFHTDLDANRLVQCEKWFFVNGTITGNRWLQCAIDESERHFLRRVTGIRNKTYGLTLDVVQSLIQRSFGYSSADVRNCYYEIRKALLERNGGKGEDKDNGKTQSGWKYGRVVVLAHSQGGLILSLALDMLLADLSVDVFSRLEIYTFANAANHFSNPPKQFNPAHPDLTRRPPSIEHIEHFANEKDFVARYGVLGWAPSRAPDSLSRGRLVGHMDVARPNLDNGEDVGMNQFAGKVFEHFGAGGHALVHHYYDRWLFRNPALDMVRAPYKLAGVDGIVVAAMATDGRMENILQLSRLLQYRDGGQ